MTKTIKSFGTFVASSELYTSLRGAFKVNITKRPSYYKTYVDVWNAIDWKLFDGYELYLITKQFHDALEDYKVQGFNPTEDF